MPQRFRACLTVDGRKAVAVFSPGAAPSLPATQYQIRQADQRISGILQTFMQGFGRGDGLGTITMNTDALRIGREAFSGERDQGVFRNHAHDVSQARFGTVDHGSLMAARDEAAIVEIGTVCIDFLDDGQAGITSGMEEL